MFILSNVLSLVATLGLTASLTQPYVNARPHGSGGVVPCFVAACHHSLQLSLPASRPFLASSLGGASFVASSLSAYGHLKNWYV